MFNLVEHDFERQSAESVRSASGSGSEQNEENGGEL